MTSQTMRLSEVYNLADQVVSQRLSQLPGVSQVGVFGGAKTAVRVQVNPAALAAMGMSMEDVRAFLEGTNQLMPKGSVEDADRSLMVSANDQISGRRLSPSRSRAQPPVQLGARECYRRH
jgi:multidrug efflux pump subunit AcrB